MNSELCDKRMPCISLEWVRSPRAASLQDSCPIPDKAAIAAWVWEHNDFFLRRLPEESGTRSLCHCLAPLTKLLWNFESVSYRAIGQAHSVSYGLILRRQRHKARAPWPQAKRPVESCPTTMHMTVLAPTLWCLPSLVQAIPWTS
eukprot:2534421-Amphidinium_carterae.1